MSEDKDRCPAVLVVDDDEDFARMLLEVLEPEGYRVWHARNGVDAKAMLQKAPPSVILLDLMLPDIDGLVLYVDLRSRADVPVVICSATHRKRDSILGLKLGAEDFVAKPVDIDVLKARLEAALRRHRSAKPGRTDAPAAPANGAHDPRTPRDPHGPRIDRVGELVVDHARRQIILGDEPIHVTPLEFRLVAALARRPDVALSRRELTQLAWGQPFVAGSRAIDGHVRRLRAKLDAGAAPAPPIVSVRGFGYKLMRERGNFASPAA